MKKILFILFFIPYFLQGQILIPSRGLPSIIGNSLTNGTPGFVRGNIIIPPSSLDVEAKRFLDSAVITNTAVRQAVSDYVTAGKAHGWWQAFQDRSVSPNGGKAIYPCISDVTGNNTASLVQMKWNLLNPVNADSAFRLTYNSNSQTGDPTASPSGLTFAPGVSWANTYLKPASKLSVNSQSIGYYSTSTSSIFQYDMGTNDFIGSVVNLFTRTNTTVFDFSDQNNTTMDIAAATITNTQGMFIATRTGSAVLFAYRNGTQFGSGTQVNTAGGLPNQEFFLGTIRNGGGGLGTGSTKTYATMFIGPALSPTMELDFTNDTNTLQGALETALGLSAGTRKKF